MLGLQPQVFLGLPLKRGAGSLGALVLGWGGRVTRRGGQRWSQHLEVQREEAGSHREPEQRPLFGPWKDQGGGGGGATSKRTGVWPGPLTLTVVGDLLEHSEHPSWGQAATAVQTEPPCSLPTQGTAWVPRTSPLRPLPAAAPARRISAMSSLWSWSGAPPGWGWA